MAIGPERSSRTGPPGGVSTSDTLSWSRHFRRDALGRDWDFIRRVLIAIALVGLAYFFWSIGRVLLLVFAAVLLGVLFRALADLIARYTLVSHAWALFLAVLLTFVLIVGFLLLFGAQVGGQAQQMARQLPQATEAIGERFGVPNAMNRVEEAVQANASGNVLSRVAGLGFTVLGVIGDIVLVIVAGIYLAANPTVYRHGMAKLFPPAQHDRLLDAFDATATALRLWSGGQLIAMLLVGAAAGLAFWLIGLPSPLMLGIIAGLTNFIPFLGPILGSVPALIFAATLGASEVLLTIGAVVLIQQLEGNLITPMIQKRAVSMPPALALFAIVVFGLLFGLLGIFLAVPLAVAIMVLVKKLWVRDALGEQTSLPGEEQAAEHQGSASSA